MDLARIRRHEWHVRHEWHDLGDVEMGASGVAPRHRACSGRAADALRHRRGQAVYYAWEECDGHDRIGVEAGETGWVRPLERL